MTILAEDADPEAWWVSLITPELILIGAGVLVVLLMILAVLGWWASRKLRRSGVLERGMLNARAGFSSGADRDIAALRLRLRASVDDASRLASSSDPADLLTGDLAGVLARLQRSAAAVDADLQELQAARDPARQQKELEIYRGEVNEIVLATARVREAVTHTTVINRATELRTVSAEVDEQVSNLDSYRQAYRELGG